MPPRKLNTIVAAWAMRMLPGETDESGLRASWADSTALTGLKQSRVYVRVWTYKPRRGASRNVENLTISPYRPMRTTLLARVDRTIL